MIKNMTLVIFCLVSKTQQGMKAFIDSPGYHAIQGTLLFNQTESSNPKPCSEIGIKLILVLSQK